ncbi:MAG: arsenate reductase (glutaredoxin) [Pseudomonadota bacterium]
MGATIYHNPKCGTSRNTLAILRDAGIEPEIIEYLKTPPGRERLVELIRLMDIPVRDLLRQKGSPYDELELADDRWTDDELIDFMVAHPILMNRPVVVTEQGAALCRPKEKVYALIGKEPPAGS